MFWWTYMALPSIEFSGLDIDAKKYFCIFGISLPICCKHTTAGSYVFNSLWISPFFNLASSPLTFHCRMLFVGPFIRC